MIRAERTNTHRRLKDSVAVYLTSGERRSQAVVAIDCVRYLCVPRLSFNWDGKNTSDEIFEDDLGWGGWLSVGVNKQWDWEEAGRSLVIVRINSRPDYDLLLLR